MLNRAEATYETNFHTFVYGLDAVIVRWKSFRKARNYLRHIWTIIAIREGGCIEDERFAVDFTPGRASYLSGYNEYSKHVFH